MAPRVAKFAVAALFLCVLCHRPSLLVCEDQIVAGIHRMTAARGSPKAAAFPALWWRGCCSASGSAIGSAQVRSSIGGCGAVRTRPGAGGTRCFRYSEGTTAWKSLYRSDNFDFSLSPSGTSDACRRKLHPHRVSGLDGEDVTARGWRPAICAKPRWLPSSRSP